MGSYGGYGMGGYGGYGMGGYGGYGGGYGGYGGGVSGSQRVILNLFRTSVVFVFPFIEFSSNKNG